MRIAIEWADLRGRPLMILTHDNSGFIYDDVSTPLYTYTPVETTVNASESDVDYHRHVYDLARDCVNQGGIENLLLIRPPSTESDA